MSCWQWWIEIVVSLKLSVKLIESCVLPHMQTHSDTYVASRVLISSIRFSLWVWWTWVQTELSSSHIPPPWWWALWSCGVDRGPGASLLPEFYCFQLLGRIHCLVSRVASAFSAAEAGRLEGSEEDTGSEGNPVANRPVRLFSGFFKGLLRLTVKSHLSDFVCHYVSVRGSQGDVEDYHTVHHHHRGHWHRKHQIPAVKDSWITSERFFRSGGVWQISESVHMNLLANKRHCPRSLRNLLGDKEEEHSLAQKSGDRHGALLTARCKNPINIRSVLVRFCVDEDRY